MPAAAWSPTGRRLRRRSICTSTATRTIRCAGSREAPDDLALDPPGLRHPGVDRCEPHRGVAGSPARREPDHPRAHSVDPARGPVGRRRARCGIAPARAEASEAGRAAPRDRAGRLRLVVRPGRQRAFRPTTWPSGWAIPSPPTRSGTRTGISTSARLSRSERPRCTSSTAATGDPSVGSSWSSSKTTTAASRTRGWSSSR